VTNFLIIFGLALLTCAVLTYAASRALTWWGAKQDAVRRQSAATVEDTILAKEQRIIDTIAKETSEDLWAELEDRHGTLPPRP
jgi:hypothetical protein